MDMISENTSDPTLPTSYWLSAANVVQGNFHDTDELNAPSFRSDLENHYVLILFTFTVIVLLGTALNMLEIYVIIKNKLYLEATNTYFLNLAVADIIKCNITLPFSVMSLLFQNWILGEFLCYFLPMLQDVPVHVTMLTLLMLLFDRFLFVRNPAKPRLPGFIFSTGAWLTAICVALPYPIYTMYLDFEEFTNVSLVYGAGVCVFGVEKNLKEYSHGIFIGGFVLPLLVLVFLFIQIFQILDERDQPIVVDGNEIRLRATFRRYYNLHRFSRGIFSGRRTSLRGPSSFPSTRAENTSLTDTYDVDPRVEEKRVQYHFLCIVIVFVVCFAPLNTLSKVALHAIHETYDMTPHMDKIFVVFTIIAFLPTIITPLIVFSLLMNDEDKIYLRDYFKVARRNGRNVAFELGENNFNGVAYITHLSAATISTDGDVDAHRAHPLFSGIAD